MVLHKNTDTTQGIHIPYNWEYADATARTGATGFVASDVGKICRQLDTNVLYMLTAITPTWVSVGSGIANIVEDTTPQLGGDLDLNGKNIDFPTTTNISDCLDEDNMASDSNTMLATQQSIKAYVDASGGGFEKTFNFPAGSWDYPDTNPADEDVDTGTNGVIRRQLFDDSTEEFVLAVIQIPTDIDTSGTVTFEAYGYATTWITGKNIELKLYHSAKSDGEDWDAAYASKESGDLALNTSAQDVLDLLSFTETVANLGWVAGDQVRIKLSRIDASADDLAGDWGLTHFRIRIPQS